eukprot:scaffold1638_cov258-Pinguiococcus_pyrenoidosus.AAC.68
MDRSLFACTACLPAPPSAVSLRNVDASGIPQEWECIADELTACAEASAIRAERNVRRRGV